MIGPMLIELSETDEIAKQKTCLLTTGQLISFKLLAAAEIYWGPITSAESEEIAEQLLHHT